MKTLIAYCSRHGSAQKIAHLLNTEIKHGSVRLLDLSQEPFPENLNDYDQVIIGGSIHFGKVQASIRKFCDQFMDQLMHKRVGLYLCYMLEEKAEKQFNKAFPDQLRNHAIALGYFGGELLVDKMNFLEKFIVRGVMKETQPVFNMDEAEVDSFLTKMNLE